GSLGVDLETTVAVTLTNSSVTKIPSQVDGPLSQNQWIGGLLIGRSSAGLRGLIVIPGVIDADYVGNIQIMAYTLNPPLMIPVGSCIVQIVPLQSIQQKVVDVQRQGGFGPVVCSTRSLNDRPTIAVKIEQDAKVINLMAMIDTGADVTIIS
ncbi:hypothetical protein N300_12231, partial [Calypte anna]